jgi:hypothetical protein
MRRSKVGPIAVVLLTQCLWAVPFADADVIYSNSTAVLHDFALPTGPTVGIQSEASHALKLAGGNYRSGKHNKTVGKHHGY